MATNSKRKKLGFGFRQGGLYVHTVKTAFSTKTEYRATLWKLPSDERKFVTSGVVNPASPFVNLRKPFMVTDVRNVTRLNNITVTPGPYSMDIKIVQGELIGWIELGYVVKGDFEEFEPEEEEDQSEDSERLTG